MEAAVQRSSSLWVSRAPLLQGRRDGAFELVQAGRQEHREISETSSVHEESAQFYGHAMSLPAERPVLKGGGLVAPYLHTTACMKGPNERQVGESSSLRQ